MAAGPNLPNSEKNRVKIRSSSNFICGVVEGFYGRPWTTAQRKDLFQRLKKWGLDSYVYAPKDDYKHRAYWRELYTVEEAEHLTSLITAAKENNVTFYYALSPGLDITYSSPKEVSALKRKLEQVAQFGCAAFALLFDDVEPEMHKADKEIFHSFAQAQVAITNEVCQHMRHPKFLFCPTEYCGTRAVPDVANSEYLNTLGSKLLPEIDIMWTGPLVVSRTISVKSIQEITDVLRRPPVIWDNIHANDYDQRRIFMGPYSGRSPELISKLNGVLTNPNCEYGPNFIAIHTLLQWSKCDVNAQRDLTLKDTVSADIKLETETEDGLYGEDYPANLPPNMYHPRFALRNAIEEWLPEFSVHKTARGPLAKPHQPSTTVVMPVPIIPSVNTCMTVTNTTTTVSSNATTTSAVTSTQLQTFAELCSTATANNNENLVTPMPMMNSLVSSSKIVCNDSIPNPITVLNGALVKTDKHKTDNKKCDISKCKTCDITTNSSSFEPMDCNSTPNESPCHINKCSGNLLDSSEDIAMAETSVSSGSMQISVDEKIKDSELTIEDLALLCDLFYLPFEHGRQGLRLLYEFHWLKCNAPLVMLPDVVKNISKPEVQEWFTKAAKLNELAEAVNTLFQHLAGCNNRELVYDLYSYVWEMRGVISLLNSYVKWLAGGHFPVLMPSFTQGNYTWFSKGWKEAFMSGNEEPWVFRGGLIADLQRLIPVDSANDLFVYKAPDVPTTRVYNVRPYTPQDTAEVYFICTQTCNDGMEDTLHNQCELKDLHADRFVGPYLALFPEFCMVIEDDMGIVGYACAAPVHKLFRSKQDFAWIPKMCLKYPLKDRKQISKLDQEDIAYFHGFKDESFVSSKTHPSSMVCSISPSVSDPCVSKQLVSCMLAALRANGLFGVHVSMNVSDSYMHAFYGKLGFIETTYGINGKIVMGRTF